MTGLSGATITSPPSPTRRAPGQAVRLLLAAVCATFALLVGPLALPAHAEPLASTYDVQAKVGADGTVAVTETITFDGAAPGQLTQKLERRERVLGDKEYVFDYSDVTVKTKSGTAINATVDNGHDLVEITAPTAQVNEPVVISYTVTGTTVAEQGGGAQLRLLMLQGLSVPVKTFTGRVEIPGQFSQLGCLAGPPGTDQKCKSAAGGTDQTMVPTFNDGPRGVGEIVAARITFPAGVVAVTENVDHVWTVRRAFTAGLPELLTALGLLIIGGIVVFALHRRSGVDARSEDVTRIAEFTPTGEGASEFNTLVDVHPGHIGTLQDERVDPIDITASVVDLAVRGHLLITELPTGEFSRTDWTLSRVEGGDADDLRPFESHLLDTVAPAGESIKVSELGGRVHERIHDIQSALYDEVVDQGWYDQRPDRTRNTWFQTAVVVLILGIALTGVLAAFTTFGLAGLAVVIVGLALLLVAQEMPARTRKGVAVLRGLEALRSELLSAPTDRMPKGRELSELSEVLPFAVVLGGSERWLDAIVAADTDEDPDPTDLDWYHGPDSWHLGNLPESLRNFVTTVSGTLFTR